MRKQLVTAEMLLPEMIRQFPATRAVLDRYGLRGVAVRKARARRSRGSRACMGCRSIGCSTN